MGVTAVRKTVSDNGLAIFTSIVRKSTSKKLPHLLKRRDVRRLGHRTSPLFNNGPPRPLPGCLKRLLSAIGRSRTPRKNVGIKLIFSNSDSHVTTMSNGNRFLDSRVLVPVLVSRLASHQNCDNRIIGAVDNSGLVPTMTGLRNLRVCRAPMNCGCVTSHVRRTPILLNNRRSNNVNCNRRVPRQSTLVSTLCILRTMIVSKLSLDSCCHRLRRGANCFSRCSQVSLPLTDVRIRTGLLRRLTARPPARMTKGRIGSVLSVSNCGLALTSSD